MFFVVLPTVVNVKVVCEVGGGGGGGDRQGKGKLDCLPDKGVYNQITVIMSSGFDRCHVSEIKKWHVST